MLNSTVARVKGLKDKPTLELARKELGKPGSAAAAAADNEDRRPQVMV